MIDLRSDTLTLPTPAMRQAMFEAQLGDDGFCEDPTVKHLEAIVSVPDYDLDLDTVQTNIVMWKLITDRYTPQELLARLEAKGVRIMYLGGRLLRAVIYTGISTADIEQAVQVIAETMNR